MCDWRPIAEAPSGRQLIVWKSGMRWGLKDADGVWRNQAGRPLFGEPTAYLAGIDPPPMHLRGKDDHET